MKASDLPRAREEWEQIYPLVNAIMAAPFSAAVKTALEATGFAVGNPRLPVLPLDASVASTISRLASALPATPSPALSI
jgi:4-hydroxy-tetrahydrodipicolinate synthase